MNDVIVDVSKIFMPFHVMKFTWRKDYGTLRGIEDEEQEKDDEMWWALAQVESLQA